MSAVAPAATLCGASLTVLEFYEKYYRPARHPGNAKSETCAEFRSALRALTTEAKFERWKLDGCPGSDHWSKRRYKGKPIVSETDLFCCFRGWAQNHDYPELDARLIDLSDTDVVRAMSFLVDKGRSRTTANKIRLHINAVWRFAHKKGLVPTLPKNEKYKINLSDPVALMPDELTSILRAAKRAKGSIGGVPAATWWPAAILFIYSLGIRLGAALKVPTVNLDLDRGDVLIAAATQKHRRDQRLDLFPSAIDALRGLRLGERGVQTVLGDWPHQSRALRERYKTILVDAGLFSDVASVPRTHLFHCLRRTLASALFEKAGIHVACDRLAHSGVQVTERYIDPRYKSKPMVREILVDPLRKSPAKKRIAC